LILYVVHAHFIDKIEEGENPGPKCLWIKLKRNNHRHELKKYMLKQAFINK
jgi:hypothetical protein